MSRAIAFVPLLLLLASCEEEPENIQTKAENLSRELERKAVEIENEAENAVAAQIAPLDNEANTLLGQLDSNAAAEVAGNQQVPPRVEGP